MTAPAGKPALILPVFVMKRAMSEPAFFGIVYIIVSYTSCLLHYNYRGKEFTRGNKRMKKRLISLVLVFCTMLSIIPMDAQSVYARENQEGILYGDADGNGAVELLDANFMERYAAGEEDAVENIRFTEADVNADGVVDDIDIQMVKDYLVGNLDSLTPVLYTLTFDTDGGDEIEPIRAGGGYPYRGEIPSPSKDAYVFVNWTKEDGSVYYPLTDVVSADMTLKAVYEPVESSEQLNITSFSLDDQPADVSFEIVGDFAGPEEVKNLVTVLPKDGSDPVAVEVANNGGGSFTVYAPDGFMPGGTYELTLGDGLSFADKEEMFRTAYFMIRKDEEDNLKYNPDMIFLKDTEEMQYTVSGETVDVLESALLSNEESVEAITGSFTMTDRELAADDVVCIYESTDPRERDYTQDNYENDAVAYIRITGVDGDTYQFESLNEEDTDEVLAMPDTVPYQVASLPDQDGTVNKNDYDAYARSMLGMEEAPVFEVNDFLVFYTEDFSALSEDSAAVYGQVTDVSGDTVSYRIVDRQEIEEFMGMFVTQDIDGSTLIDEENKEKILQDIKQQAEESGFAEEAANRMVSSALETEEIQERLKDIGLTEEEIQTMNASAAARAVGPLGGRTKYVMDGIDIEPTFIYGENFENGIGVTLEISLSMHVEKKMPNNQISQVQIELNSYFEQEVALGFDVNVEDRWKWYLFIPVLEDLDVTVSVDIQDYTAMSVSAKVYTLRDETAKKKWKKISETVTGPDASPELRAKIRRINQLAAKSRKLIIKNKDKAEETIQAIQEEIDTLTGQLPNVSVDGVEYSVSEIMESLEAEDVSEAFDEMFEASTGIEARTGLDNLMERYQEMLSQECDWIDLLNVELYEHEFHVNIVAIKVAVNLIVRANVNVAIGADLEYQVGKRYTFWLHIMDMEAGSSEIDLIDERFGFQFYVMGTLGLKAGIKADIAFGLLSTSLASIGANVEFGAYLKLYGYFIYYFERLRPAGSEAWNETEELFGALYLDFGLYVTVNFKAQLLGLLKYEPTLYNGEFPLITVGDPLTAYDFATSQEDEDLLYVRDDDIDSSNGIAMTLPAIYQTMKTLHLVSGEMGQQSYPSDKFIVTFNDSRFRWDNGKILVDVPEGARYLECEMRIVWKCNKLAFSKFDTDITVPVVWTNMTESELKEKFTASVEAGNLTDGYEPVWSGRYGRVQTFDLPTEEEILELLNYDSYNTDSGNLKYESVGGYQEPSTDQSLTTDRTWRFDITPKRYTVTVEGVQKADGTVESRTYEALYGESFDFSDLSETGTNNPETNTYTTFVGLTDQDGGIIDSGLTVDMAFAEKYGSSLVLTANYQDDTLTATYKFVGLGEMPDVEVPFKKGTTPYLANLDEIIGDAAVSYEITPTPAPSESSVTYTVLCRPAEDPDRIFTLSFDTNGGNEIKSQRYAEGNPIYQPTAPVRTGYTFSGWFADQGLSQPFDFTEARMPGQDMTIYAGWNARSYTVSFEAVNGADPAAVTVEYGAAYGELPVLTHETLRFLGWFTERDGGSQVTAETVFENTGDQTLYAHWAEKIKIQEEWITVTPQTYDYDENEPGFPVQFAVSVPDGDLSADDFAVTYQWEKPGSEWTEDLPVNAGGYLVKLSYPGDDKYLPFEDVSDSAAVSVRKIYMSGTGADEYLKAPNADAENWEITVDISRCGIKGDGKITYELLRETDDGWSLERVEINETGIFNVKDQRPGTNPSYTIYTVIVHIAEGTNYYAARTLSEGLPVDSQGNESFGRSALLGEAAADAVSVSAGTVSPALSAAGTVMPMSLAAENETCVNMKLSPEEVVLNRGKEFEISLDMEESADIWGIFASIGYDPEALELLGYTYGGIFTESQFTVQEDLAEEPYRLLAALDGTGTVLADGNFVVLKFRVREDAPEKETAISFEKLEIVGEKEAYTAEKGSDVRMSVDNTAPVISGIEDGETYFGDTEVMIKDENLASVTVNGTEMTVTDGKILLVPREGSQTVTAVDKAGNSTSITVTVKQQEEQQGAGSGGAPGTGDDSHIILWAMMLLAAGGVLGISAIKRKRMKR